MKVNLQDVVDTLDMTSTEDRYWYDVDTDRFVDSHERNENHDLIALPDHYEINDYGIMEDFIEQVKDDEAREWLGNAIRGRGAFRMFRATCERFDLTADWYRYKEQAYRWKAIDWCLENGLEYYDEKPLAPAEDEDEAEEDEEPVMVRTTEQNIRIVEINRKNLVGTVLLAAAYLKEMKLTDDADLELARDLLEEALERGDTVLSAVQSGQPVGFVTAAIGVDCLISHLYVKKDFRRHGIGSLLLQRAAELAEESKAQVFADIGPDNRVARQFLNKNGYGRIEHIRLTKGEADGTDTVE